MVETITNINDLINGIVWGWPALILLGFVGILMTCLTGVFQISHFGHWIKNTIGAIFSDKHVTGHTSDKSISQFQSLCTALAATVGTGNIVGGSRCNCHRWTRCSILDVANCFLWYDDQLCRKCIRYSVS